MFPFIDVKKDDVLLLSETIKEAFDVQDCVHQIRGKRNNNTFSAITTGLNYLRQLNFNFNNKQFIDCLGNGSEACLYANVFGFKSSLSVEINNASYYEGLRLIDSICSQPSVKCGDKITATVGSFLDVCDPAEFSCLFLDATILRSSMLDESFMINRFLQFCEQSQHGSFVLLLTVTKAINLSDYLELAEEKFVRLIDFPIGDDVTGRAAMYIYRSR